MAVGAPRQSLAAPQSGTIKIYHATTGALVHLIPNPEPAQGDNFGSSLALNGDRSFGYNDDGEIAFRVGFLDGSSAIVVARPDGTTTPPG